jgi:hypothetical protein
MIAIDKHIPLPGKGRFTGYREEVRQALLKMKRGDSILINREQATFAYKITNFIAYMVRKSGKRFSAKQQSPTEYRVWRVK